MIEKGEKNLILGIGNFLLGDEGIGVHVARRIMNADLPDNTECLEGGTGGFLLLEAMQKASRIVIIDAIMDGQAPGTINRLTPRFSKDYPNTLSAHDIGLKDLLDSLYILGSTPEIILIAVSIKSINDLTVKLSDDLEGQVDKIAGLAIKEVQENTFSPVDYT